MQKPILFCIVIVLKRDTPTKRQGDVVRIVNTSGATMVTYTYDAWGKVTIIPQNTVHGRNIANANPLRYRGYYYDSELGMYYLQSRYYDPAIGRFINADSYASTGQGFVGCNMFAYCGNNPVSYVDEDGYALSPAAISGIINGFISALSALTTSGSLSEAFEAFLWGFVDGYYSAKKQWIGVSVAIKDAILLMADYKQSGASDKEAFVAGLVSFLSLIPLGDTGDDIVNYTVELIFGTETTLILDGTLEAWRRNIEEKQIVYTPTQYRAPIQTNPGGKNGGCGGPAANCQLSLSF